MEKNENLGFLTLEVHPKLFETVYIKKEYLENELRRMLIEINDLDYRELSDYDKGGFDGFNQAVTELLKKVVSTSLDRQK